jgi:hypothetical protein
MRALKLNPKSEFHRLLTFKSPFGVDWPVDFIKPEDLAANGFIYTGNKDIVTCVFCGIRLEKWRPDETPQEEHKYWNPCCLLIRGFNCGNIPIKPAKTPLPDYGEDVCGWV